MRSLLYVALWAALFVCVIECSPLDRRSKSMNRLCRDHYRDRPIERTMYRFKDFTNSLHYYSIHGSNVRDYECSQGLACTFKTLSRATGKPYWDDEWDNFSRKMDLLPP